MDERRRRKRTDLDAQLKIKRTDGSSIAEVSIDVVDVSLTGIGFMCEDELELGVIYEGTLTIWTKEKIKVFSPIDIAGAFGVSNRTIINWCSELCENGYLKPNIVNKRIRTYTLLV